MIPEAFIERIKKQFYINSEELLRALKEKSTATIRLNRKKWEPEPINSSPVPWCRDGFFLDSRPSYTMDPLFHAGCYYPQEASGMFLEEIFRQLELGRENVKILDLCGAPGGKSTHLSSLTGSNGLLVANEVIRSRAGILAENLTRWGIPNVIVTQSDPSSFGRIPGFFDIIVADAPCSGEGMFRDEVAVNEWSVENAAMCSDRQKRILMDVWPSLKEEGILIYSTCTFNPEENEENIAWLTEKKGAESLKLDVSGFQGITEINHRWIFGYGFYPGKIRGEGFFISVIRKREKTEETVYSTKVDSNPGISREEIRFTADLFDTAEDRLLKYYDEIIALPCKYNDYRSISGALKIVKAGTRLFKTSTSGRAQNFEPRRISSRNFASLRVPLHDLALSVNCRKDIYPTIDLSLDQAQVYLSRGQFSPETAQKGWNLVRYNGVNLGFINNIGSRINNYYPMEWRIRMDPRKSRDEKIIEWRKGAKAQWHKGTRDQGEKD